VLHPDRLLPAEPTTRDIARRLYRSTKALPLVCPHGHYDPAALAADRWLVDPATELVKASAHADLLVLGSHGARMISELLLGSVTTQCVRHAPRPVVVITADSAQRLR